MIVDPVAGATSFFQVVSSVAIMAPPPSGLTGTSLTLMQAFLSLRGVNEFTAPLPYSKFADENIISETSTTAAVDAKTGFLIIYGPALFIALGLLAWLAVQSFVPLLLTLHFGKRVLEASFLHDFSGSKGMPLASAAMISSYYAFVAYMIGSFALPSIDVVESVQYLGFVLFAVGELGNLYHHWLLQELKDERREKDVRYVAPKGGLFSQVATPHYLFEILAWVGVALVAQQFNAYLEIVSTGLYLAARSRNTNQLYFRSLSRQEWPASRKNLIPFIY